jgi:opacity protein-like surface antigen
MKQKSKLLAVAMVAASLIPFAASAMEWYPYISAAPSLNFLRVKNDSSENLNDKGIFYGGSRFAVGVEVPHAAVRGSFLGELQLQLNTTARRISIKSDIATSYYKAACNNLLANVYYQYNTGTKIFPYAGLGIGVGFLNAEVRFASGSIPAEWYPKRDNSSTGFAWQAIFGAFYAFRDSLSWEVECSFGGFPPWEGHHSGFPGGVAKVLFGSVQFSSGIAYTF